MSVYRHLSYRAALQEEFENRRARPGGWTVARLAGQADIQPSYVTNVLKGRADFSLDQLYAVGQALGLAEEDREYLLLLLDHERSQLPERRTKIKTQIDERRAVHLKTEMHLGAEVVPDDQAEETMTYYLNPFAQLVHVFLNFEEYAAEPKLLCAKLALNEETLGEILGELEKARYIERGAKGYKVLVRNRHLPKESPLRAAHQTLLRYKSIDQMQRVPNDDQYSFSVTFSSTEEDKANIQRAFLDFVKKSESIVKGSQRQQVYQINFDLFPWGL